MPLVGLAWTGRATKQLEGVERDDRFRIVKAVNKLTEDPSPSGSEQLTNEMSSTSGAPMRRIRCGNIRVVYSFVGGTVYVERILHRKDVYRKKGKGKR